MLQPRLLRGRFACFNRGVHELGIATAILERVQQEAERHPGARFTKVGVRVGELSGVDPDALAFGFEALVKDTDWEALALEIDYRRRLQRCRACGNEFPVTDFETRCRQCGALDTACIAGEELDIAFIEVEEP
jgi:hydrogenase nickel incorporation protein HypA/HybF